MASATTLKFPLQDQFGPSVKVRGEEEDNVFRHMDILILCSTGGHFFRQDILALSPPYLKLPFTYGKNVFICIFYFI